MGSEMCIRDSNDIMYLMVGNKTDLHEKRQVTQEEAAKYAENNNIYFMEVSAKSNIDNCVNVAFDILFKEILNALVEKDGGFVSHSVKSEVTKKRANTQKLIKNSKVLDNEDSGGLKRENGCCGI